MVNSNPPPAAAVEHFRQAQSCAWRAQNLVDGRGVATVGDTVAEEVSLLVEMAKLHANLARTSCEHPGLDE